MPERQPIMGHTDDRSTPTAGPIVGRWLPLGVLLAVMATAFALGWHRHVSFQTIGQNYEQLRGFVDGNVALALGCYMALYVGIVALSIPVGLFMTVAGGVLFGWQIGGPAAVFGATVGASLLFLIVRSSLGAALAARAGPFVARLRDGFSQDALSYMLFLRLVPILPFFIVNLVPAVLGIPFSTFVIATALGVIPATMALSLAGSGLGSVITTQNEAYRDCLARSGGTCTYSIDLGSLVTPQLLGALAALGLVALIPVAVKTWSKRNATK